MAPWVIPAAIAGSAVLGGLMSSQASSSAADKASKSTQYGIDMQNYQYQQSRQDQMPYYQTGLQGLQELTGYQQQPLNIAPYDQWERTNHPGGTGNYDPNSAIGQEYLNYVRTTEPQTGYVKTGEGIDPTGGASKYLDQLEGLSRNFQFDPNNPNYKIQQEETERAINQAYAARGMYNSRPAVNSLADNSRKLAASELERQQQQYDKEYSQDYAKLFDLFNMSTGLGQLEYGKTADIVKAGQNAAGAMNNASLANAQGLASSYGDLASINMAHGANQSALWSGLGAMPLNYMMLQNMFGGQQTPQTGNPYMAPQ